MAGLIDELTALKLTDYERGWVDGVLAYAHMRDGVYYVGTTGSTLDNALRSFFARRGRKHILEKHNE
jgi:hypothetical protein